MTEPIVMGSRASEIVQCNDCQKEMTVEERHSYQGKKGEDLYFCDTCLQKINDALQAETENLNYAGAIALGLVGGLIGGAIWFTVVTLSNMEIGYLALGLGWLVGQGVCFGAGRKKGPKLQILAAIIALITILVAEIFIFSHFVGQSEEFVKEYNTSASAIDILLNVASIGTLLDYCIDAVSNSLSPISMLIWSLGIWFAYKVPSVKKI